MPWKERELKTMREEFVKRVLAGEKSKASLCREYGISRPTGDKWIARYQAGEPMEDRSRAPQHRSRQVRPELEAEIVAYRTKYPAIGAVKIRRMMENAGKTELPCAKTINNIFARNGLITKEASQAATRHQRYEKAQPNEMWQADFKGHFALKDGVRCHTLNILDDCSRYALSCEPLLGETYDQVMPVLYRLFREYGLPFSLLCDNGNPWGTAQTTGYTRLEVELMELGILTLHGRPRHPQTQGKEERFNGSFTRECLKYNIPANMAAAAEQFEAYRQFYNLERPHHALDLQTPASRYCKSCRPMPKKIEPWEYPAECEVRKVKTTGYFNYKNQGYFLSEAFGGKEIAIRESHLPGQITLLFRQFRIGRIHLEQRVFTSRRIYLLEHDPREFHER